MKHKSKEKPEEEKRTKSKERELEELRQRLDELQKAKDEVFEKLQRVSADYANFQKRVPKQIADTIGYEKEKIIKTLLPVLDNFEHSLQSFNTVQDKNAHSAEDAKVLAKGVQIICDQMLDTLKLHGVEQIEALGEKFDPALHQAMMRREEPDKDENTVLEEFQKGYKLNGRVIRPSKVIVNAPAAPQNAKEEPEETKADLQEQGTDDAGNEE